jgi:ribose transport system substrate-binding protein
MKADSVGRWAAGGVVTVLVAALSACAGGGTDGGSGGDGGKADNADLARYQKALDGWYKGTYKKPEGPAVKAPADKDIWLVSVGMGIEYSVRSAAAAKDAAATLGWKLHVFDAKFDSNQMLTGVQQAVVAKADGIIILAIDCATIKNATKQAIDAGIPVVSIEGKDCDPGLYSHVVTYRDNQSFKDSVLDFGEAQAAWVIAKTKGQARVVLNTGTDTESTRLATEGQKREFKECPTCKIVGDATWVTADFGPPLQEKIQQEMVKHPDANAFIPSYDAMMTQSGGTQALAATGRMPQIAVAGGEGTVAGIEQIRSGTGMQMCAGQSVEWETYSGFDALARLFLDRDPNEVDTGNGIQVCDKDHNLPPKGKAFTPPVDFVASFDALWGRG